MGYIPTNIGDGGSNGIEGWGGNIEQTPDGIRDINREGLGG